MQRPCITDHPGDGGDRPSLVTNKLGATLINAVASGSCWTALQKAHRIKSHIDDADRYHTALEMRVKWRPHWRHSNWLIHWPRVKDWTRERETPFNLTSKTNFYVFLCAFADHPMKCHWPEMLDRSLRPGERVTGKECVRLTCLPNFVVLGST